MLATSPGQVLVLNRSYMPVHITSVKRAFCMVYLGVAKVVDQEFQTFDFDSWADLGVQTSQDTMGVVGKLIRVPRVILLQMYDRLPKKQVRFSRINIFSRDRNTCQYCTKSFARVELNLDHVIPRSRGGKTNWENIVCSCIPCNRKKGGRTPAEAHMKLMRVPKKPSWRESLELTIKKNYYHEWKPFLGVVDFSYWNVELEQS